MRSGSLNLIISSLSDISLFLTGVLTFNNLSFFFSFFLCVCKHGNASILVPFTGQTYSSSYFLLLLQSCVTTDYCTSMCSCSNMCRGDMLLHKAMLFGSVYTKTINAASAITMTLRHSV